MAKITNAMLLRYGINLFWSFTLLNEKLKYSKFCFDYMFYVLLKRYGLQIIKIEYSNKIFIIYVICLLNKKYILMFYLLDFKWSNYLFLRHKLGFFFNMSLLKLSKEYFSISLVELFLIKIFLSCTLKLHKQDYWKNLADLNVSNFKKVGLVKINFNKIIGNKELLFKKINSKFKFIQHWKFKLKKLFPIRFNLSSVFILYSKKSKYFFDSKLKVNKNSYLIKENFVSTYSFKFLFTKLFLLKKLRLKMYRGFLIFKILSLKLRSIISMYYKFYPLIQISNFIYSSLTYKINNINIFEFKRLKLWHKGDFFLIFISFMFFTGIYLLIYLSLFIKKINKKMHYKYVFSYLGLIKKLFLKQLIPLLGFKFKIMGRLGGSLRKKCILYKIGRINLFSLNCKINYTNELIVTKYGVMGLKLWLCDLNDFNKL